MFHIGNRRYVFILQPDIFDKVKGKCDKENKTFGKNYCKVCK